MQHFWYKDFRYNTGHESKVTELSVNHPAKMLKMFKGLRMANHILLLCAARIKIYWNPL